MTLVEYLKMRRAVEQAPTSVLAKAEELVKEMQLDLVHSAAWQSLATIDSMWDALIAKAEEAESSTEKK